MAAINQALFDKYITKYSQSDHVLAMILSANSRDNEIAFIVYVRDLDIVEQARILSYENNCLISITHQSLSQKDAAIQTVEGAIFIVPEWRNSQILYDPQALMTERKQQAQLFTWNDDFQKEANQILSHRLYELAGLSHKILGGLQRDDWAILTIAATELANHLAYAVLLQRLIYMPSHNDVYRLLEKSLGTGSSLWNYFATAIGLRLPYGWQTVARMRGLAALNLYLETIKLFDHIIETQDRIFIETVVKIIEKYIVEVNPK